MSDHESEELDVLDDVVVTKYKMAAEVTNSVLSELIKLSVPGAKIVELCKLGDQRIQDESAKLFKREKAMKKGISYPTSMSVNNIICHYSPIDGEENEIVELKDGDLVKIDLGAHIDGYAAVVGHTFVVGSSSDNKVTGRKADVIIAANTAAEVAVRLLRSNYENIKVSEMITKTAADFNCRPIEGMQSHQMRRMVYDAEKSIVLNPSEEHKKSIEKTSFELNEVWNIDILLSTGSGKPRDHKARTTIYKKNETLYQLKMKSSRQLHSEIASKFLAYPFNIRALEDLKKARLGITECAKHDVVQALPVYCEKDDEFVAQFRFTVLLMPNGPMRITGFPFDASVYKSEFKPRDAEVKDILLQPIKTQNKKKKGAKPSSQSTGDADDH
ncbi:Proliferation-associated protein 2G4 [Clonorchis sinensis]|uniref:Proliferation-associated protein 2G4 n=2 Tax=Clonorchis sinensis TaxID=79923 RepID=A0A8T1MMK7_CLOSI|nr:Proliferation-associated protein 2G4 [Clonorchis sinensis]